MPDTEAQRIQALDRLALMDTPPDTDLNDLAWLAAYSCGTPYAQINLVHTNRVWTKANVGFPETEIRRQVSPCSLVVASSDIVIIPDTYADERISLSPLVVQGPRIRFYAGVPLTTARGDTIGTLCVMDAQPRRLSEVQQVALWALAKQVLTLLGVRPRADTADARPSIDDDVARHVHEYNQRMRQLVEQMPAALWATDDRLRITMSLGGALDAIHMRASQIVGKTLFEVFDTEDPQFAPIAAHARALAGEIPGPLRWTGWGTTMEVRIIPLRRDDGTVAGTLGIGVDVTERVKMHHAMERVEDTFRALVDAASRAVPIDGHEVEVLESRLHTELEGLLDDVGANPQVAALFEGLHRETA